MKWNNTQFVMVNLVLPAIVGGIMVKFSDIENCVPPWLPFELPCWVWIFLLWAFATASFLDIVIYWLIPRFTKNSIGGRTPRTSPGVDKKIRTLKNYKNIHIDYKPLTETIREIQTSVRAGESTSETRLPYFVINKGNVSIGKCCVRMVGVSFRNALTSDEKLPEYRTIKWLNFDQERIYLSLHSSQPFILAERAQGALGSMFRFIVFGSDGVLESAPRTQEGIWDVEVQIEGFAEKDDLKTILNPIRYTISFSFINGELRPVGVTEPGRRNRNNHLLPVPVILNSPSIIQDYRTIITNNYAIVHQGDISGRDSEELALSVERVPTNRLRFEGKDIQALALIVTGRERRKIVELKAKIEFRHFYDEPGFTVFSHIYDLNSYLFWEDEKAFKKEIELRPDIQKILVLCEFLKYKTSDDEIVNMAILTSDPYPESIDFSKESIFQISIMFQGKLEGEFEYRTLVYKDLFYTKPEDQRMLFLDDAERTYSDIPKELLQQGKR
jgi:hypothetical protein